jgi:hypothetical protein
MAQEDPHGDHDVHVDAFFFNLRGVFFSRLFDDVSSL